MLDPLEPATNVCKNVDVEGIRSTFKGASDAFKELSADESNAAVCVKFFELTTTYIRDMSKESGDAKDCASFFDSSYDELESSIEIMELILASIPSSGALARLIAYILEQRGPLPVGNGHI